MHVIVGALGADMGTIIVETWCQLLRWSSKIPVIRSLQEIRPLRLVSLSFLCEVSLRCQNLNFGRGIWEWERANKCKGKQRIIVSQCINMAWYHEYHVMFACIATAMIYPHLSYFSWYILKFDQIPMIISYSVNMSDSTRLPQDVEHQESASAQEPSGQVGKMWSVQLLLAT